MGVLVLFVAPAAFFVLVDALLFRRPPPWVRSCAERIAERLHPPPETVCDPFDTLQVQHRLAALAAEIQRLDDDRLVFAKAHRIKVAQSAYDSLLTDACRLAGIEPLHGGPFPLAVTPGERARGELELASRGWFW